LNALLGASGVSELEQWFERDLNQWFEERLLPVTKAVVERWGILSARALDRGTPLPNIDGLIAATALESDLILVTRNGKDFVGIEVTIVNPWEA
jgi:predicted nucleic acid-binding protein